MRNLRDYIKNPVVTVPMLEIRKAGSDQVKRYQLLGFEDLGTEHVRAKVIDEDGVACYFPQDSMYDHHVVVNDIIAE